MRKTCEDCGAFYDDAKCWTICPHPSLDQGPPTKPEEEIAKSPDAFVQDQQNKSLEPILQFFTFGHLPVHLQAVSSKFAVVACSVVETLPRNPERTVALRKLLEAKDAAVRAAFYK